MRKIFLTSIIVLFAFSFNLFAKDISAYLVGSYIDEDKAQEKLIHAGFKVISSCKSVKNAKTIIFTNVQLIAEGAKPGRAFASILRLFIDKKMKMISFTNPIYFGKAFMQDDYDPKVFNSLYDVINKEFKGLKGSVDKLDADEISGFHFMMGMPYYENYDKLGEGSDANLLEKVKAYKKGKLFLFELKLSDSSTLVGYDLSKRTKKFVKKIGRANGAVLPYCISIENAKAISLEPKYYLAISYPLLTMREFATIATVPGAIKKDLSKPFKK